KPVAERPADLCDLVGGAVQCAARHHKHPLGLAPACFLGDDLGRRPAEDNRLHLAKIDAARMQHFLSSLGLMLTRDHPQPQRSSPNRPIAGSFSAGTAASMPILRPSILSSNPSSTASRMPARP